MVEHRLPKPVVTGSIPVSRSNFSSVFRMLQLVCKIMAHDAGGTTLTLRLS